MNMKPLEKARAAWGSVLPDWIERLATECGRSSQSKVAAVLDRSGTMVSQVLSKTYPGAQKPTLKDLSLQFYPDAKIGIVGPNGTGKSTLMKIMAGLVEADAGARVIPPGVTVGYMEQEPDLSAFETLGEFAAQRRSVMLHAVHVRGQTHHQMFGLPFFD